MTSPVRIAGAQAFWGDRNDAAAELLYHDPDLDYLILDYLAEVSMSILALQRQRDPLAGYARDFIDVVCALGPYWQSGGTCRLITNAGGLNPQGCAQACRAALEQIGCRSLQIGIVTGDDVVDRLRAAADTVGEPHFTNLDTGAPIHRVASRMETANAYLGAQPIVTALEQDAEIVITGRVADPSLTVAACRHHFGWSADAWEHLAGATVAGHLIECGTQVTGGISTDWLTVPDPARIGFPIVEVDVNGNCVVTKPPGTGGCVTELTVKEQLVYEIGDPTCYLSPDVELSLESLTVKQIGADRVRVAGAIGKTRPTSCKVSATYRDGFRAAGTLTVVGRDAAAKARRCGEIVLQRVSEAGYRLRSSLVECLGSGDAASGLAGVPFCPPRGAFGETVLRIAVEADAEEAVRCFARELMPLVTAGPQGTTGYAAGRPRVQPVFRFWPCQISFEMLCPQVELVATTDTGGPVAAPSCRPVPSEQRPVPSHSTERFDRPSDPPGQKTRLYDIACARSGDKGENANIGVIARSSDTWSFLQSWLTAQRVAEFFSPLNPINVERYELPQLQALNFVLHGVLRESLRTDAQGKALGQILLELPIPPDVAPTIPRPQTEE